MGEGVSTDHHTILSTKFALYSVCEDEAKNLLRNQHLAEPRSLDAPSKEGMPSRGETRLDWAMGLAGGNSDFLTIQLVHLQLRPSAVINPQRLTHVAHPFQSRKQVDWWIDSRIIQNT